MGPAVPTPLIGQTACVVRVAMPGGGPSGALSGQPGRLPRRGTGSTGSSRSCGPERHPPLHLDFGRCGTGPRNASDTIERQEDPEVMLRYRDYVVRNALASLRHRYAGSALGFTWHVLYPLAQIALYALVFTGIMRSRMTGLPDLPMAFPIYLCAGLLPWLGFVEIVTRCTDAMLANANILQRTRLPEVLFFALDAFAGFLTMSLGACLVFLVAVACGIPPAWAWLWMPLLLAALSAVAFGLGMVFGVLNVFTRDVAPLVGIGLQLALWTLPIVYVETILPESLRALLPWNPLYPFVTSLHRLVLDGASPPLESWLVMALVALTAASLGYGVLRVLRRDLKDAL